MCFHTADYRFSYRLEFSFFFNLCSLSLLFFLFFPLLDCLFLFFFPLQNKPISFPICLLWSSCGVCGSEEAKYKCPACLTHTCSLLCVKKHKDDSGCSGVRNKTAFVTLSHFDEMTLLNVAFILTFCGGFPKAGNKMNTFIYFLLIYIFCILFREKQFLWYLKLIFPQSSSEFSQRRVSDSQTLIQILTAYIHPTESDPVTRQKLKMYVHHQFEHVKVFMKAEGRKANSVRYHELDIEKSLRDNLSYKTIIEYPVLHVVLRDHWKDYPLKGPGNQIPSHIFDSNFDLTPEMEPPLQKKAKRGTGEEEQEEGEIVDSSDEEEETSSRDQCLSNYLPGDASTCRERAEVTVTEKNPVDGTECVLTPRIQVGNDSAAASDSCQME
uniref:Box C/D snoRNA protein 1 n=1 Tax=Xiphophorus couchianus TaxID=32473 RepID=A0A3B5LKS9_9TELE